LEEVALQNSKQVDLARSFANLELTSELRQRKVAVAFVKTLKKAVMQLIY